MDKYKRLLSNTLIFAIGIFGSKLLSFLMMPYLTRVMNTQQFGQADLIFQAGNFLLPVVSLGITNSIIRFGLDKAVKKEEVFSTGILAVFFGFLVLLVVTPLLSMISFFKGNTLLICVFVLMSSLRSVCAQFTRAKGEVRLFAFDGILSTLTTIGFYVLFLSGLKWGATGYVLAMVCSDALSVVFLSIMVKLPRYVSVKKFSWNTSKEMLKYSVPMIPNSMFWWITNVSNRFMITHFLGTGANGLYSAASKIPTAISLVGDVFLNAWQISAVTEEKQRGKFFSRVFRSYSAVLFICAAVIILFSKVVTKILVADTYYESWKFIPLLTVAIVFSNLVTFLGSVYMVEKRSLLSLGDHGGRRGGQRGAQSFADPRLRPQRSCVCHAGQLFCGVYPPGNQCHYPHQNALEHRKPGFKWNSADGRVHADGVRGPRLDGLGDLVNAGCDRHQSAADFKKCQTAVALPPEGK